MQINYNISFSVQFMIYTRLYSSIALVLGPSPPCQVWVKYKSLTKIFINVLSS